MPTNLKPPRLKELKPRIMVCGVGGAGGNAVNNMIVSGLSGVDFIVANTDARRLNRFQGETGSIEAWACSRLLAGYSLANSLR